MSGRIRRKDTIGRIMNDPSFIYGKVWGPMETVERSIVLLQLRLAKETPDLLTDEYLDREYTALLASLEEAGLCVVTSFTQPTLERTAWFSYQRAQIARFRE